MTKTSLSSPRILFAMIAVGVTVALGCSSSRPLSGYDPAHISWVKIKGGEFVMGDTFGGTNEDALPAHRVHVGDFNLSRFETSFEQYDFYAHRRGLPLPLPDEGSRGRRAVSGISWDEAVAYCKSAGGRLPSEIEWEYAATGGPAKQLYAGTSDSLSLGLYANYHENSEGVARPVGSKAPNVFGLFDMSGNVGEWIGAYYQSYPEDGESPVIADEAIFDLRIVRGGSVWSDRVAARTYWRNGTLKEVRTPSVGVRCARD